VAHRLSSLCSVAVMLFGVRWQAQRDPLSSLSFAGLRESTGAQCAECHIAVEKAPSQLRFALRQAQGLEPVETAGAVQNAPAFGVRSRSCGTALE